MKKIIIPALIIFFAVTMLSCKKEGLQQVIADDVRLPVPMIIASDWLSLSFNEVYSSTTTRNLIFQNADHLIRPAINFDPVNDTRLAYLKIPGRSVNNYYQIPRLVRTPNQNLDITYLLEPGSFNVRIWNADDHSQMPNGDQFSYYRFRYIVIPNTMYQNLHIDWNDYYAVAAALNLSL